MAVVIWRCSASSLALLMTLDADPLT